MYADGVHFMLAGRGERKIAVADKRDALAVAGVHGIKRCPARNIDHRAGVVVDQIVNDFGGKDSPHIDKLFAAEIGEFSRA